jgi:NADH-quinone oxidoreductase subunit G
VARVTLSVDGVEVEATAGELLLTVLRGLGVRVPTLCHDERLNPYGGCRLCVVHRRDTRPGLVPACSTPVVAGMQIETASPEVVESRRRQLQILALNHRMECPVCDRSGDCRFQDLLHEIGVPDELPPLVSRPRPRDESWPVIVRDLGKCVVCGRCVRLCEEVQGVSAIGFTGRGLDIEVATFQSEVLDCELCGQCVNACPAAALLARPYISPVPNWLRERRITTCSFCSCGCQIELEVHDGRAVRVTGPEDEAPNRGKLCAKGWLGWDVLSNPERLTKPMVRRSGRLVEVKWTEAYDAVAGILSAARRADRTIALVGSPRLTREDAYLLQRLGRGVLGSPHVGVGPSGGVRALVEGVRPVLGVIRSTATFDDLAASDLVLVLRADPSRTHPLVKTELVQGARQRGRPFVLAAALGGGLERHAAVHLQLVPGAEVVLARCLAARLLEDVPERAGALAGLPGFDAWRASLAAYRDPDVAASCGVEGARLREVVAMIAAAGRVVVVLPCAGGLPGDEAEAARAAAELALLLGAGLMVFGEKANVQGVLQAGLHPQLLPGGRAADDPTTLRALATVWGSRVAAGPGWGLDETCRRAAAGEVGALLLVGEDPVDLWPRSMAARAAVERIERVVVLDPFLTETGRLADVVIPVAALAERVGTVVCADGRSRRMTRALEPPAGLPQDGEVIVEIARRLGSELPLGDELSNALDQTGARRGAVPAPVRLEPAPPPTVPSIHGDGPMLLDSSPQLFHSGSVTTRSRILEGLAPTLALWVHPDDACRYGLASGEPVAVTDGRRELLLRARLDRTVMRGTVRVAQHGGPDSAAQLLGADGETVCVELRRPN